MRKSVGGRTPLHYACRYGQTETARLLIENNASVNAYHFQRDTPLHVAVEFGHPACAELLIEEESEVGHYKLCAS